MYVCMVWYSMVWYGMIQYGMVLYLIVSHCMVCMYACMYAGIPVDMKAGIVF